ncbi:MAG: hypothetical protein K2J75_05875, partial [Clostridia bacterium]|nr:hypothetical protein [Clostridia bacterium]
TKICHFDRNAVKWRNLNSIKHPFRHFVTPSPQGDGKNTDRDLSTTLEVTYDFVITNAVVLITLHPRFGVAYHKWEA